MLVPRSPEKFMDWSLRDRIFPLQKTKLMGVVNVTPDSFSDGGRYCIKEKAIEQGLNLIEAGADILDLGAESTRPGACSVSSNDELSRLLPVLKDLRAKTQIPISIDTTKADVAKICLEAGADIINDVSGLDFSGKAMAEVIKQYQAGFVLMHRRGNPMTMQSMSSYEDVVEDVFVELKACLNQALDWGIEKEKIVIDPGIGFAKDTQQNIKLIANINRFFDLGHPVLLGPSRKRFIGDLTGKQVNDREFGTAAVVAWAVLQEVPLVRVHDIDSIKDVLKILEAIQGAKHVRTF